MIIFLYNALTHGHCAFRAKIEKKSQKYKKITLFFLKKKSKTTNITCQKPKFDHSIDACKQLSKKICAFQVFGANKNTFSFLFNFSETCKYDLSQICAREASSTLI